MQSTSSPSSTSRTNSTVSSSPGSGMTSSGATSSNGEWNISVGDFTGNILGEIIQRLPSVDRDEGLEELAASEQWDQHLHCPITELSDCSVYKKMLAKIFLLKDMWRHREPKVGHSGMIRTGEREK